jgi:predicted RNA-binding protein with PUA-like domain
VNYWLLKSEPNAFGINDLAQRPLRTEHWDGVRNYQARNLMRDQMQKGDLAFFYHSNCTPPGITGIVEIVRAAYPDHTSWDPASRHFDSKSTPDRPRWFMVDIRHVRTLNRIISLYELKQQPDLTDMILLRPGNRLSVMPVTEHQWQAIVSLE